jgi:hypothetical protein
MPQIILYIEHDEDPVSQDEKIGCYIINDILSSSKIKEVLSLGKMVLSMGDNALNLCKEFNLDGVIKQIDTSKPVKIQLKSLRESLKKKTLGVIVPARRHEAMLAGEVEPEFITFYSDNIASAQDVISWYNEFFLIPLAWQMPDKEKTFDNINADFVIIKAKNFKNFG